MLVVTGGAGFVGSNLVHALGRAGHDVLVVDDLADGRKFANLVGAKVADYLDKDDFLTRAVSGGGLPAIDGVFHQGACTDTTEWDGRLMMKQNYEYSKAVLALCQAKRVPMVYASSAAVYGASRTFHEDPACEAPLNVYGYSKLLFDEHVRRVSRDAVAPIVGLRYFNVYGPREAHKGKMASVAWQMHLQLAATGRVELFEGSDGYGPGEQRRDFVYVEDVVAVNAWFMANASAGGIFNVGTGRSQPFNDVARAVLASNGKGEITYKPFPPALRGRYQSFTEANLAALRAAGYEGAFATVEQGVATYLSWVAATAGRAGGPVLA